MPWLWLSPRPRLRLRFGFWLETKRSVGAGCRRSRQRIVTLKTGCSPKDNFFWDMAGSPWLLISLKLIKVRSGVRVGKAIEPETPAGVGLQRENVLQKDFSSEMYFLCVVFEGTYQRLNQGQHFTTRGWVWKPDKSGNITLRATKQPVNVGLQKVCQRKQYTAEFSLRSFSSSIWLKVLG